MERKSTGIRQKEIKKAVLEIIKNEGIKAVSTKNLANYAGLSEGAIFRHFKTKRDIISAILDDVSTDLIELLRKISSEKTNPRDRLSKFICSTINYLTDNNGITILLFTEASHSHDEEMIKKLNYIFNSQRELAGKIIADGMADGTWDNSISIEDVTMMYMGIPITFNINLILSKEIKNTQHFCDKMMNLIERMLVVNPNV